MLANFFEKTKPINSIVLILLFLSIFFLQKLLFTPTENLSVSWYYNFLFFIGLVSYLGVVGTFFIRNLFTNENLLALLIVILSFGFFPETLQPNTSIIIAFLTFLIFRKLTKLKEFQSIELLLFDCGLFTGIAFIIFDWSVLYLIFIYLSAILSKKYTLKSFITPIIGFATPVFLGFTYYFISNDITSFNSLFEFETANSFEILASNQNSTAIITYSSFALVSFLYAIPNSLGISNDFRYEYLLSILLLFTCIGILYITPSKSNHSILLVFVPNAILINQFFYNLKNKTAKEIILSIYIFCSLYCLLINS